MADKTGAGQTGAGFYSVMMRSLLLLAFVVLEQLPSPTASATIASTRRATLVWPVRG